MPAPAPAETFKADQLDHWAFQPVRRTDPPPLKDSRRVRNAIDSFVQASLQEVELETAPEADRLTLIRRLTFDLVGLPPTSEEVSMFLKDQGADAYERLVDRLLASPQYGVRWAQHWLDLAHYADTNGFEADSDRTDAWRYRDWVVQSLNDDMPYKRFVELQIAGDEIEPGSNGAMIATGFGRCGPRLVASGNIDPEAKRQAELTEVTGTVGSVFLGLTMACARCHDHKFDPLPTTDYYRLQAFFAGTGLVDKSIADAAEIAVTQNVQHEVEARIAPFSKRMEELEAPYRERIKEAKKAMLSAAEQALLAIPEKDRTRSQKKMASGLANSTRITWEDVAAAVAGNELDFVRRERLKRAIHELKLTLPRPPAHAMALVEDRTDPPQTFVFRRGDVKNKGPLVEPRPPGILLVSQSNAAFARSSTPEPKMGRRESLALWLTSRDNPLTSRVIINRLWQHHFGKGIVATPSDFGARGEPPTHPELLDWLASELVANGWLLKPMHKLMVMSATYRQVSNIHSSKAEQLDPENALLWRMNRSRLDAESLRDALLAVSGEIDLEIGGPGVRGPLEPEVKDLIFTESEEVDLWPEPANIRRQARRSLYLFRKRNVRYPLFDSFDAPDTQSPCAERAQSTHALQALTLLNGDFAIQRAKALAGRTLRESPAKDQERIEKIYRLALCRAAKPNEIARAADFLRRQSQRLETREDTQLARPTFVPAELTRTQAAAWVDLALALVNSNEFAYVR